MPSLFKTVVAVVCLVFALCFAAPNAHADSFTDGIINFTVTSGSPTPTGSFVFDNTTNAFTSFTVDWDGAVYDFSTSTITLAILGTSGGWCASGLAATTGSCQGGPFQFCSFGIFPEAFTYTDVFATAEGTYTVTETAVAAPEPSSLALMLAGV